jgi:hypothetical protein
MACTGSETEQGPGRFLISAAAALVLKFGASTVAAAEDASNLPSTWHLHDGQGVRQGAYTCGRVPDPQRGHPAADGSRWNFGS